MHRSLPRTKHLRHPTVGKSTSAKASALAEAYGFGRHQRVYACSVSFADVSDTPPAFLDHLISDG